MFLYKLEMWFYCWRYGHKFGDKYNSMNMDNKFILYRRCLFCNKIVVKEFNLWNRLNDSTLI